MKPTNLDLRIEADIRAYLSVLPIGTQVRNIRTDELSCVVGASWDVSERGWRYLLSNGTWQPWQEVTIP